VSDVKKKHLPWWQETLLMVAFALLLSILLKTFLVQAFYIPSESMQPTLNPDDKILVQKVSYWRGDPERGDVIVFKDSAGWLGDIEPQGARGAVSKALQTVGLMPSGGHLVKRVIGVGGDTVSCCDEQGRMVVNGVSIEEPYLNEPEAAFGPNFTVKVPEGYLWVQGDNRNNSGDSRAHMGEAGGGFIPVEQVVGKTWMRMWPLSEVGTIPQTRAFQGVK